jgi:cobalt-zinc-cadmium efflux system membrane fusion protein
MKNIFIILALFAAFAFAISSCQEHTEGDGHAHGEEEAEHGDGEEQEGENPSTVSLTNEQMKSIGLQLSGIERKSLTSSLKANGFLKVPNQNKATITSLYGGIIKSLSVMPGSIVSKGQTIAVILNPQLIPMQEEFLNLAPKIELAETEFKRQQELTSGNAGALKNLQTVDAELKSLRIRRSSLGQQLRLMGINTSSLQSEALVTQLAVKSPISGSVSKVLVNTGSSVDASTPIAEVVDNSQLHLDLFVYEKDLPHLRKGQIIHFIMTNQPGMSYTAEVFSIGTTFENESKSIAVHAIVKGNKQGLIDGMSVTAQISVANASLPALPNDAFVNLDGIDYVFIQSKMESTEEHKHEEGEAEHKDEPLAKPVKAVSKEIVFEKIPVKKGTSEMGYSEVTLLKEVPKDSKFVTKGAFFLLAKMTNAGEAHDH